MNNGYRVDYFALTLSAVFCIALSIASPALAQSPASSKSQSVAEPVDPSFLRGFQLRPNEAVVKINGSLALRADYCFLPSGGDSTALVYECDNTKQDLAQLLPTGTYSNWRVNNVPGGNDTFGRVVGSNNTATFKAPKVVPAGGTVAVSVDMLDHKGKKSTLVSNVTILGNAAIYVGTFKVRASGEGGDYVAYGNVAFQQNYRGATEYKVLKGDVLLRYAVKDCAVYTNKLKIREGELVVEAPFEGQHQFALGFDSITLSCNGVNIDAAPLGSLVAPCGPGKGGEGAIKLVGDLNCDGVQYQWRFSDK